MAFACPPSSPLCINSKVAPKKFVSRRLGTRGPLKISPMSDPNAKVVFYAGEFLTEEQFRAKVNLERAQ